MAEFKDRLSEAMTIRHISASELSRKTGFSRSLISEYLKGKYQAKSDKIYTLAKVLDVSESWLMGYDVEMNRLTEEERLKQTTDLKVALFGGEEDVTDEMWQEVMDIVEYVKAKHKKG